MMAKTLTREEAVSAAIGEASREKELVCMAMRFKSGDEAFIVESNRFIREVEIRNTAGGMYLIKFTDMSWWHMFGWNVFGVLIFGPMIATQRFFATLNRVETELNRIDSE